MKRPVPNSAGAGCGAPARAACAGRGMLGRRQRAPAVALLVAAWVAAAPVSAQEALHGLGLSVARYQALKQRAADDDEAAGMLLGAYVAGLFAGIGHANAQRTPRHLYCAPPGLDPELREVLNFIDEAVDAYREREGADAAQPRRVHDLLLDALVQRFPCQ